MSLSKKIWRNSYLKKYLNRDGKILNSSQRTTTEGIVNLHWWSMQNKKQENIGDFLSVVVYKEMLLLKGIEENQLVGRTVHLYGIGSIIQGGAQSATVWGSGLKNGISDIPLVMRVTRKLDVRLVRGPETRNALLTAGYNCPEVYGDPAILMPLFYQPKETGRQKSTLVILHKDTRLSVPGSITPVVDTNKYKEFIDKIYNASVVISSSLHGIILAEAYGVSAILLKDTESDNLFKYDDYYHSTGRYNYPIACSVEEALSMTPSAVPDLCMMQNIVMDAFPYDLWKSAIKNHD